jgi:hypothetical protein
VRTVNWVFSRGKANDITKFTDGMKGDVVGRDCSAHLCLRWPPAGVDNIQIFSHLLSCSACVIGLDTENTRLLQHGNAPSLSIFPTREKLIEIYVFASLFH